MHSTHLCLELCGEICTRWLLRACESRTLVSHVRVTRFGIIFLLVVTESTLSATNVKGFPIVSADSAKTLLGYIERAELRYVLGAWFLGRWRHTFLLT